MSSEKGFTLIELLIVIGILAILSTTVILVVNPAEYLKKSRDTTRLADLSTINKAVSLYQTDGGDSFGTSNTVYVSVPDTSATCVNLGLPSLPAGWSYACVIEDNLIRVNGNGWIPIDFTSLTYGTILSALPLDPTNTVASGNYYTYTSGSWKLTAMFESEKYAPNMNKDGGPDIGLYELGSDLNLANFQRGLIGYWRFDEGSGTLASDSSGNGNNGILTNGPTWTSGKFLGAVSFDGEDDYITAEDINAIDGITELTVSAWIKIDNINKDSDVFAKGTHGTNQPILFWRDDAVGSGSQSGNINAISVLVYDGDTQAWTSSPNNSINDMDWHHIVFTFTANTPGGLKIYVDGVNANNASTVNVNSIQSTSNIVTIGSPTSGNSANIFSGSIDDVRVYNRALSASEIKAIYDATK